MSVFLLSLGSPVPSPDPLIPALSSLMGPLVSVLQAAGTAGGGAAAGAGGAAAGAGGAAAGGAAAGGAAAGGAITAPVIAGTVGTVAAPAMMAAMSSLLPGIGLGLLKGIFLG